MTRARALTAILPLLIVLSLSVEAQEKPMGKKDDKPKADADPELPYNPFAKLTKDSKGDWLTATEDMKSDRAKDMPQRQHLWTIESVEGDTVVVKSIYKTGSSVEVTKTTKFSKSDPLLLNKFIFGLHLMKELPGITFGNLSVSDTKQKINGKDVKCKKVTATASSGGNATWTVTLVFSDKVRSIGVCHFEYQVEGGGTVELSHKGDAAGTGTDKKTEWGKTIKDLEADAAKAKDAKPEEPKKDGEKKDGE